MKKISINRNIKEYKFILATDGLSGPIKKAYKFLLHIFAAFIILASVLIFWWAIGKLMNGLFDIKIPYPLAEFAAIHQIGSYLIKGLKEISGIVKSIM